jgi:hypothetical protein
VNQPSDVQSTDWDFQALKSLDEHYSCLPEEIKKTFQENRAIKRVEFASALYSCTNTVSKGLNANIKAGFSQEDLETVQKLQQNFHPEESKPPKAETICPQGEKQFPKTTKLDGQIIFAATDASNSGGKRNNLTLSDRVRLNLKTSFTGEDQLLARLQASNVINPNGPGYETGLSFKSGSDTSNSVQLSKLEYRFPFPRNENICVMFATGFNTYFDDADVINPLKDDSNAAISRFGRYSPIYRLGGDTGIGVTFNLRKDLTAQTFYLAGSANANDPNGGNGLFNGKYGALAQIIFYPKTKPVDKDTKVAFTYVNAYNNTTTKVNNNDVFNGLGHNTGSFASNLFGREVSSNSYGIETNVKINEHFQLGGWLSYTNARALTGAVKGDADIWSSAVTLAFPSNKKDINKGNLLGIIIGMEPKLTGSSAQLSGLPYRRDPSTGFHIEAFYRYQINDKINITPGLVWLTAPNHDDQNGDILLGVVRTTFKF